MQYYEDSKFGLVHGRGNYAAYVVQDRDGNIQPWFEYDTEDGIDVGRSHVVNSYGELNSEQAIALLNDKAFFTGVVAWLGSGTVDCGNGLVLQHKAVLVKWRGCPEVVAVHFEGSDNNGAGALGDRYIDVFAPLKHEPAMYYQAAVLAWTHALVREDDGEPVDHDAIVASILANPALATK